jgi:uncharacterized surface protein with fasciclin (FAS1) repeats
MRVNGALVLLPPGQEAANGMLYIIDRVLMPPQSTTQMEEAEVMPATEESEQMGAETPAVTMEDDVLAMCIEDYVIQADDWLSKLAEKFYGDPLSYPAIFEATNAAVQAGGDYDQIADANIIEVGQIVCIPGQEFIEPLMSGEIEAMGDPTVMGTLAADGRFSTLIEAINLAGMEDRLQAEGPYTLFAPTNTAFDRLPADELAMLLEDESALSDVLIYHIVPGELRAEEIAVLDTAEALLGGTIDIALLADALMINDAQVIEADISASNGVIHAIDAVLQPGTEAAMVVDPDTPVEDAQVNLLETLVQDGRYNLLFEALQTAGLTDLLTQEGPYTVFAPTDDAFANMGDELGNLLQDQNRLAEVLGYHVVSGAFTADELTGSTPAPMSLIEQELEINIVDDQFTVNGAEIIDQDLEASNGIIHGIDTVLMPPE